MIIKFSNILQDFPERIIISQNQDGKISYPFCNDSKALEILSENSETNEFITRSKGASDSDNSLNSPILQIPLSKFLSEERASTEDSNFCVESSIWVKDQDTSQMRKRSSGLETDDSIKWYQVKTKLINWQKFDKHTDTSYTKETFYIHIFVNTTLVEKIKNEKTLRKYQRVMISSVAHEFRNPLNSIQGNLELIKLVSN